MKSRLHINAHRGSVTMVVRDTTSPESPVSVFDDDDHAWQVVRNDLNSEWDYKGFFCRAGEQGEVCPCQE